MLLFIDVILVFVFVAVTVDFAVNVRVVLLFELSLVFVVVLPSVMKHAFGDPFKYEYAATCQKRPIALGLSFSHSFSRACPPPSTPQVSHISKVPARLSAVALQIPLGASALASASTPYVFYVETSSSR